MNGGIKFAVGVMVAGFGVALVTSALSLGRIEGVREGTVLSVFLVGTFIGLFSKVLPK